MTTILTQGDAEPQIQCDYAYGLSEAIRDGVCRKPSIVLIDNDKMQVNSADENQHYDGVEDLLSSRAVKYQDLLHNEEALHFCLSLGCEKLDKLRATNPSAGGLVVASSIAHAQRIAAMLVSEFGQSVVMVTHKHQDAGKIIDNYRNSSQQWIVSVGMISEGTDIPRLQVCCHLSRITTELYFRQVLGRILRVTKKASNNAWLYTFAEPQLTLYAERVAEELPTANVLRFETLPECEVSDSGNKTNLKPFPEPGDGDTDRLVIFGDGAPSANDVKPTTTAHNNTLSDVYTLECLGAFRSKLVDMFSSSMA